MQQLILGHAEYRLYVACGSDFRIRRYLTGTKLQALCFAALFIAVSRILDSGWLFTGLLLLYGLITLLELRGFFRTCTRYRNLFNKIMELQQKRNGDAAKYASYSELADRMAEGDKFKKAVLLTRAYLIVIVLSILLTGIYADLFQILVLLAFIWLSLGIKIQYANEIINWKRIIRENGTELVNANVEICVES